MLYLALPLIPRPYGPKLRFEGFHDCVDVLRIVRIRAPTVQVSYTVEADRLYSDDTALPSILEFVLSFQDLVLRAVFSIKLLEAFCPMVSRIA